MICWHKWSKWVKTGDVALKATRDSLGLPIPESDRYVIAVCEEQRRECGKCGKSQLRTARA